MNHPPAGSSFIQLPTGSAFSLCDGLLRMAHRLIIELPESELKDVRCILDTLSMRVDQLLDSAEIDHSLGLDGLSIDPGKYQRSYSTIPAPILFILELSYSPVPGAEDFGAVMVSTTVTTTTDGSTPTVSSPNPRRNTTGRVPIFPMTTPSTPAPTPAPAHTPTPAMVLSHGPFPLVRSSRENVGYPDYTYHPLFVRAGSQFTQPGRQDHDILYQESQALTRPRQLHQGSPTGTDITSSARAYM